MNTVLIQSAIRTGFKAARANAVAGGVLQLVAILFVIGYFSNSWLQRQLNFVGEINVSWSPLFAIVVTMIFGAVIPLTIEAVINHRQRKAQRPWYAVVYTMILWAFNGFLVEKLYALQSRLFGDELTFLTVLKKVLVDQLLWVPFYVTPFFILTYLWRDRGFSWLKVSESLKRTSFTERALTYLISNWFVWIPAVSIIYSFPAALQLILMNLILVFWSLIMTYFSQSTEE